MFSVDSYVLEFIKENFVTLGIVIGFLKTLAKRSENTLDDSILSYFGSAINGARNKNNKEHKDLKS